MAHNAHVRVVNSKSKPKNFSYSMLAFILVAFGAIGYFIIRSSFAGGYSVNLQAEKADQAGSSVNVSCKEKLPSGTEVAFAQLSTRPGDSACPKQ